MENDSITQATVDDDYNIEFNQFVILSSIV